LVVWDKCARLPIIGDLLVIAVNTISARSPMLTAQLLALFLLTLSLLVRARC
jgi:hypothetical protein